MRQLGLLVLIVSALAVASSCSRPGRERPGERPVGEDRLVALARGPLRLDVKRGVEVKSEGNMTGLRSGDVLFSRRRDSRTYFAQDQRYGPTQPEGIFGGSDGDLVDRAREVLVGLDIPTAEIDRTSVLEEKTRVAHRDPESRKIVLEPTRAARRYVLVTRRAGGLPVFSSRGLIGLTSEGRVGFMEVHWPEISVDTLEEGRALQRQVEHGWQPPALDGARVELVEAGIIHSPAMGFVMDVYPAIRVVYAPTNDRIGRKPVVYFDRTGKRVSIPRQFAEEPRAPEHAVRPRPR